MLSTPRESARRHASRSCWIVHCWGWIVTPTLNGRPSTLSDYRQSMVGELTPTRVDPQTAAAATWRRFHDLSHMQEKERRSDEPVQPDGEIEKRMIMGNPFERQRWYVIERDGVGLSSFYAE